MRHSEWLELQKQLTEWDEKLTAFMGAVKECYEKTQLSDVILTYAYVRNIDDSIKTALAEIENFIN